MENITFYEQMNLFLENKKPRKPSACACVRRYDACVHRIGLAHVAKVLETHERKVFCTKD